MNILAIDYGKKRLGLAWLDTNIGVTLPFGVIMRVNALIELLDIIKEERIDTIVMGNPLTLSGEESEFMAEIRLFAGELSDKSAKKIYFVDERFTSREADNMGGDASRDEKAAMLILEVYIANFEKTK